MAAGRLVGLLALACALPVLPVRGATPYTHQDYLDDPGEFRFAVLPDLYGADNNGETYRKGLDRAIRAINLLRPQFVMSVGDLIPSGWLNESSVREQQRALAAKLAEIVPPFYCVVGNHDIAAPSAGYPNAYETSHRVWTDFHGPDTYYSFVYRDVLFVALDVMQDAQSGKLSDTQYAWFKRQLDEHPSVRWTFVFMHTPGTWSHDPKWLEFEQANLVKRKYTVFAGDWHQYLHVKRHGHDYYALSVAGGAGGMAGSDFSKRGTLLGPEYGEIDHITMVTVTKDGPVIANVDLDGVYPHDFVDQQTTLSVAAENLAYPSLDYPPDAATAERFGRLAAATDADALFEQRKSTLNTEEQMKTQMLALAAATAISTIATAGTYYVDDDNYGKGGLDGLTEQTAYGTIQDAVDNVPDGSTILVLPGTYDKGGAEYSGFLCRVLVNQRNLTIKSTKGAEETVIVGAKDPDTIDVALKYGNGPKAVRGIAVVGASSAYQTVFEGFTVTECAVKEPTASTVNNYGSAVYVKSTSAGRYATFVGCDFHGNCGSRGLLYDGLYVRCFIHDNFLPDGKGTATWLGTLVNCVVTRCSDGGVVTGGKAINCTLMDFGSYVKPDCKAGIGNVSTENSVFKNSLVAFANDKSGSTFYTNCVGQFESSPSYKSADKSDLTASRHQVVSSLTDDYRLLPTSAAVGAGDAALLADVWMPEGVDAYVDFCGNPIPKTGAIAAGAVQAVATDAGSGTVAFVGKVTVDGLSDKEIYAGGTLASADYPVQWRVRPVLSAGAHLYGFRMPDVGGGWRFPGMDETLWLMPPPFGTNTTCSVVTTTSAVYADPVNGRDESTGAEDVRGAADTPFKTLQAAVSLAKAREKSNTYSVVYAAEGVYDQGGVDGAGCSNRIYTSSYVRIKGAGAGKSVIRGHLDRESDPSLRSIDGRGPTAMRCAYLGAGALQGFTLADGRCAYADGKGGHTGDGSPTRGGGVYCDGNVGNAQTPPSSSAFVLDCVITNCLAVRGAPVFLGQVFRTKVVDCAYGQARYAYCRSCLFEQLVRTDRSELEYADEAVIGGGNYLYQCTDVDKNAKGCFSGNAVAALNEISVSAGGHFDHSAGRNLVGSLAWGYGSYGDSVYVRADPEFVDAANGDYEVHGSSPALDCGVLPDDYWKNYSSDINGNPLVFAHGKPLAGAFHSPAMDRAAVAISQNSPKGNVSPVGRQVVNVGDTLEITAPDTTRHALGLVVDGEFKEGVTTWTFVPPTEPTGVTSVEAIYSTNWYVNANTDVSKGVVGSDGNDGFTPATPKLTLEAVMGCDLAAGDVVHAAPGVYDQGSMTQKYYANNDQRSTGVRVCVDEGITLVGDEGAEKTVIKGHLEPSASAKFGGGTPLRCVNLTHGATVRGFTLTGGSTPWVSSSGQKEPYLGGGVIAPVAQYSSNLPLVQDCIISNNCACRGAGAFGGAFLNCKFIGNYSTEDGNANFKSRMENCLVDRNRGRTYDGCALIRYPYGMNGVTVTANNDADDGKQTMHFIYDWQASGWDYRPIVNCIVMGGVPQKNTTLKMPATNCIFCATSTYESEANWVGCTKVAEDAILLDEDGRPLPGSPAINFGFNAGVTRETDLDGTQRIYDGTVDAGCYEYDIRGDMAAAIGGDVTVTRATPGATFTGGKVRIPEGEAVEGTWPAPVGRARYAVPMAATDGTLTGVFANEAADVEKAFAVTDGAETQKFKMADTALDFAFGFEGTGYGELAGFTQVVPGSMLFIR